MTLTELCLFSTAIFLVLLSYTLRLPVVDKRLQRLLIALILAFGVAVEVAWTRQNPAFQWVFVEASTLLGTLLVSFGRERRLLQVAWKFLLMNSAGLGLAFLGLILLGYTLPPGTPFTWDGMASLPTAPAPAMLLQAGIWFAVFGYSAKLGLFPNHFWVADTYAESPPPISGFIAGFIPLAATIPIRNLLRLESLAAPTRFNAHDALLVFALITMAYSLLALYQTRDLRRVFALTAMFHNGALAVVLRAKLSDPDFYFYLASVVVVKTALFGCLGWYLASQPAGVTDIYRLGNGPRPAARPLAFLLLAFGAAFSLPLSPIFVSEILVSRQLFQEVPALAFLTGALTVVFFAVGAVKLLPLLSPADAKAEAPGPRAGPGQFALGLLFTCGVLLAGFGFWMELY
jgi:hydrogenase-4 component F